jgi:hypothetical protein
MHSKLDEFFKYDPIKCADMVEKVKGLKNVFVHDELLRINRHIEKNYAFLPLLFPDEEDFDTYVFDEDCCDM